MTCTQFSHSTATQRQVMIFFSYFLSSGALDDSSDLTLVHNSTRIFLASGSAGGSRRSTCDGVHSRGQRQTRRCSCVLSPSRSYRYCVRHCCCLISQCQRSSGCRHCRWGAESSDVSMPGSGDGRANVEHSDWGSAMAQRSDFAAGRIACTEPFNQCGVRQCGAKNHRIYKNFLHHFVF